MAGAAAKRARTDGGSITGGTGDVKPQILTMNTGKAAAIDDYVVNQVALPVPRFGTEKTKATIMELLSIDWYLSIRDTIDTNATTWGFLSTNTTRVTGDTSTLITAAEDVEHPLTLGMTMEITAFSTSGQLEAQYPIHYEFTDMNGNGVLIATDRIFIACGAVGNGAATHATAKLKYRLVNVGITEYVGIVQSQQA